VVEPYAQDILGVSQPELSEYEKTVQLISQMESAGVDADTIAKQLEEAGVDPAQYGYQKTGGILGLGGKWSK
jgi:hypothetical protein